MSGEKYQRTQQCTKCLQFLWHSSECSMLKKHELRLFAKLLEAKTHTNTHKIVETRLRKRDNKH